jgi:hypothetical protein
MSRVHLIDVNIEDFLVQDHLQSHLDAFLYPAAEPLSTGLIESGVKIAEKTFGADWFK